MISSISYLNEQGQRKNVEDSIFPLPNKATSKDKLFVVCDGVGGQSKGEEASRIVCEAISDYVITLSNKELYAHHIEAAVNYAISQMQQYVEQHPAAENMSTTLTLAYLNQNEIIVAWCGDSRIYHLRDGKVLWQSKDHSLVQQLVEAGEISEDEALHHPQKNIILRSMNANGNNSKIDIHQITNLKSGDYILLCTDGIMENINQPELNEILRDSQKEKNKQKLFLDYCEGKTSDNFSMYLLQLGDVNYIPRAFFKNKKNIIVLTLIGLLLSLFLGFKLFKTKVQTQKKIEQKEVIIIKDSTNDSIIKHKSDINVIENIDNHFNKTQKSKPSNKKIITKTNSKSTIQNTKVSELKGVDEKTKTNEQNPLKPIVLPNEAVDTLKK